MAANRGLKAGYTDGMVDRDSKNRYMEKLKLINSQDPYELPKHTWQDDISLWPSITYVNVCLYLVLRKGPYTEEDMLNYKSLDSFINFQKGWVREVLVAEVNTKRVIIGKIS